MYDVTKKASEASAICLNGTMYLLAGDAEPWNTYYNVPKGSRYYRSDGYEYLKISSNDTSLGWKVVVDPLLL